MGAAFDLAYQRFEDLQKAEAQAREAQIELGLERVRTRAMGMQHSSELSDLVDTLFQELTKLDFALAWCIINIIDEPSLTNMVWAANPETNKPPESYQMKFEDYPFHHSMMKGYQERKTKHVYVIEGEEKEAYDEYLFNKTEWSRVPKAAQAASRAMKRYVATFTFSNFGGLQTVGEDHLSEENLEILSRFGKVFDLTYTRFNDLKKAEIQAREARIEHALEKVRSRTMAMQHSDELPEAANVLFMEIQALGIPAWSCGYNILASDNRSATCCMSSEGTLQKPFKLRLWGESSFEEMGDFVRCNESFLLQELGGTAIKEHYDHMKSFPDLLPTFEAIEKQGLSLPTYQINHLCKFKQGFLLFITYEPVPQAHDLFKRFTTVFEQTYTRFLDLQQAEARARESQIETALERVRSRTMGMQKSDELGDVATVLFKELNKLVDNLWTCGFVLCEEGRDEDEWWLSAENGFIPAFYLPNVGDVTHANIYNAWKNGADYHTEQLEGEALQEHYDWLMNIPVAKKIFDDMRASGIEIPTWQKLHCAFFKTGYLVIITEVPCPEEEIFKRFAQAFDLTYTRFLDLQLKETQARKLAEDKEQLERTLSDLRTTQAQLIQSEKMASLGELTAGIAHEIQNPLNFVNNFSEVSKELIEEMLEEMQNGDIEEVKALAEDIIQNLEKIHHHGQRADGIVKGMLQHSRSGGGEKEPTDINVLADEYLRLAYHGLRAKDKSFNASLETYFDPALGKVNVVAQDMGRVILNLITNAFYVVKERKEKEGEGYSPTVTVTTRKNKNGVEITVKDNGNGIPDHIRDKIFQPFFTTKPAGQGTGLGLSMSYEIVTKGHNGELKVTSKEGVGTTFTIILPIGIKKN
jgi:signal transduction histidine kinase